MITSTSVGGSRQPAKQHWLPEMEQALLGEGLTFPQIDETLQLEAGTACRLRKPLFLKIGLRTRHEVGALLHPVSHISEANLRRLFEDRSGLSKRERDVLMLLLSAPEQSQKQVSERLGISDTTTRFINNRTNKRLHVSSRAEAM